MYNVNDQNIDTYKTTDELNNINRYNLSTH